MLHISSAQKPRKKDIPVPNFNWHSFLKASEQRSNNPLLKEFYQQININEQTPLSSLEYVALDFETTGLNHQVNEIVSIGLVPFNTSRVFCNEAKYWLVKPKKTLQEDSVVIHGLTHSDLEEAPRLQRILSEVILALKGRIVVVHYRHIERNFLDKAIQNWQKERFVFPVVDTLEVESWFYRKKRHKFYSWLTGKQMPSIRLAASRKRYNLPFYQGHNAMIDAIATAELFQAQIQHRFSPDLPVKWLLK